MNIIVEGIDKAGKSTIVGDIIESLIPVIPVVVKVSQKPKSESELEKAIIIARYQELFALTENPLNKEHIFLFDRAYPSEMVYSVKRGGDKLSEPAFLDLDKRLGKSEQTLLIYCEADPKTIARRFESEKEEYAKVEDIEKLLARYEIFLKKTKLPYIRINSLTDRGQNLAAVREFLKQ